MQRRKLKILKFLARADEYYTLESIAAEMMCSVKTIRNDIKALKGYLEENQLGSIVSKYNKGVLLELHQDTGKVIHMLEREQSLTNSAENGPLLVCELLLKNTTVQMNRLEERLLVSRLGVEKVVRQAQVWLEQQNITFIRRRGQGLSIECREYDWRMAMCSLFFEIMKEEAGHNTSNIIDRMEQFLNGFDSAGVSAAISRIEDSFGMRYSYDTYQRLAFLFGITVIQARRMKEVEDQQQPEYEGLDYDQKVGDMAVSELERYYQVKLPENEKQFLLFVISISEVGMFHSKEQGNIYAQANSGILALTKNVVQLAGSILHTELSVDQVFEENLFYYLKAMVLRLKSGLHTENPFQEQIKVKYPNIYAAAWSVSLVLEVEQGVEIGENEVAYIALFLGGAVERCNSNVTACLLCNYGVGVAQFLKEQLERTIPNLTIEAVVTTRDAKKVQISTCDFLLSAVPVGEVFGGKPVIRIENILEDRDIQTIYRKMKEIRKRRMHQIASSYADQQNKLFSPDLVFVFEEDINKNELIEYLSSALTEKGYVDEEFLGSVLSREDTTSTVLSGGVAIPHGFTRHILRPAVAVGICKKPIEWKEGKPVDRIFLLAFSLEEQFGAKRQIIGFYSALVSLLEREEVFHRFHSMENPETIAGYLNAMIQNK